MDIILILGILLFGYLILKFCYVVAVREPREVLAKHDLRLRQVPGFVPTHNLSEPLTMAPTSKKDSPSLCYYFGELYFDATNRKLCVFEKAVPSIYDCERLLRIDVINETGALVTQSAPTNILGRAIVGEALFGTPGAVVGAVTSPITSVTSQTNKAKLAMFFDDTKNPYCEVSFYQLRDANTSYARLWSLIGRQPHG